MKPIVWGQSDDGKFEFVSLTAETLDAGLELMSKSYFIDENVSRAVELFKHPAAIKELEELIRRVARDGVSIVAIDKESGVVAAAAFNKLQVLASPGENNYLENYLEKWKEPSSKCFMDFMITVDKECALFKECNVDCILEILFSTTKREFRCRGLAKKLFAFTVDLARKLKAGKTVRVPVSDDALDPKLVPEMVCAICTTHVTQKIARNMNFDTAMEFNYNRWSFNGKTFAESIGPLTPKTNLEMLRL